MRGLVREQGREMGRERLMTIAEFIAEIETLVLKARIGGISVEHKIAVLTGVLDALKGGLH